MKASVILAHQISGLTGLALRRMFHQRGLYSALLFGWVMAISLMAAIPIYTDAVNQRLLRDELNLETSSRRPAFGFLFLSTDSVSAPTLLGGDVSRQSGYQSLASYFEKALAATFQLPVLTQMHYVQSDLFQLFPTGSGPYGKGELPLGKMNLGFIKDLDSHATLIAGSLPKAPADSSTPVEVLVHQDWANQTGMQVGEVYVLYRGANPDPATPERPFALRIQVSGIWNAVEPGAAFWYIAPSVFRNSLLTGPDAYRTDLAFRIPRPLFNSSWYVAFDGSNVRAEGVQAFQQRLAIAKSQIQRRLEGTRLILSPEKALLRYQANVAAQSTILLVLGLPVIALILLFVMTTASSLVERQQLEISLLYSRGSSLPQVLGILGWQGIVLTIVAFLLGVPGGLFGASLMGTASLMLVGGSAGASDLFLSPSITNASLVYAGVAAILVNVATLVPAVHLAQSSVIQAERRLTRPPSILSGTGLTWDLLAAAACAYGWYLLHNSGRFALPKLFQGIEIWENPLLFLTPCLFMWTGSRILRYLWPGFLSLLEFPIRSMPGFSFLMAIRNLARQSPQYVPLLSLLLLTTSLGVFVTSVARTLDLNLADRALYEVGSTLSIVENAKRFATPTSGQTENSGLTGWVIPPFELHQEIEGVKAAARVGRFPVSIAIGNSSHSAELYGIDRAEWPQVGFFRSDFATQSLGTLMNELAISEEGLLVSNHLLEQTGHALGDFIQVRGLTMGTGVPLPFKIVGSLDYFPTAFPPEEIFMVGNLEYLHTLLGGPLPYHVWLNLKQNTNSATVQSALEERGIEVLDLEDANLNMAKRRANPARLGLFGFLSLGYVVAVLLSVISLAVHAVLNAHRRRTQLGLMQALGLLSRQAGGSLALEQIILTTLGIAGGAMLGFTASHVFVPFLQGGLTAASRIPPYVVQISWNEVLIGSGIVATSAAVITAVLIALLSRMKLFEALKLGELQG